MMEGYVGYKTVWLKEDQTKIDPKYFKVIRITDTYCEAMSLNTKHCWIIHKGSSGKRTIILYHKHSQEQPYYHKHWETTSVDKDVDSIRGHDNYVLKFVLLGIYLR